MTQNKEQLIPREILFGNPERAGAQLSPDGNQIAFLAPVENVLNVWVGPANDPGAAKPVTNDTFRGIRSYQWAHTNAHVLYIQDKGGDENWRIYCTTLATGETKDLTPFDNVAAQIHKRSAAFPEEILVGLNNRNPQLHDIYRVNIVSGERTLVEENEWFMAYLSDDEFNIRFAIRQTPDGGMEMHDLSNEESADPFMQIPGDDALTTQPLGFDKTGRILYILDSRDRNTAAFFSLNLDSGEKKLIAEDERADANGLLIHPTEKTVQAVSFDYDRVRWQIIDESIRPDLDYLATVADGNINILTRTQDDNFWTVAFILDNGPIRYYRYDRQAGEAHFLFSNKDAWDRLTLAKMHPVIIKSRDDLNLVSYLTLPVANDPEATGRPDKALPLILLVHGGPWARDVWGYNPFHQWMANRGYAVMSVNYRGSTGFGKDFLNAANLEWAGKMHDDLIDAVDWAIAEGIADADKVAIMGGSYGGYATLVGLTFTPEKFACGVDIVGPSNLITLVESVPPYWQPMIELFAQRMGDHRTEEGRELLKARSPLTFVDNIVRPLLIGQGANDPRVKQPESDQIVAAMQEKNIPVTYVLYPDEGHGFARPANNLSFFGVTEAFLAQCLGGAFEPIGDLEGSSITVPTGANDIPGLENALAGQLQAAD
eukprot:jgi/Undpi1/12105/HiC_scaffold_41.g14078.m1